MSVNALYWKEIYLAKCKDLGIVPSAARESRFLAVINQNCGGTIFNLNEHGLGENAAVAISKALKHDTCFSVVTLAGNTLRDAGAVAVGKLISHNDTIVSLDLRSNAGGVALFSALHKNTTLTSLDISGLQGTNRNHLGPKGAVAIAQALANNNQLSILSIADNGLGNEGMESLIEGLHANSTLVHLDLSSNSLDENGCAILCDSLAPASRSECIVEDLLLARNNISDSGMVHVAKLITNNTRIKTLDISTTLGDYIRYCFFDTIKLSSCGMGPKGAKALTEGLRYNGSIKHLHLERNKMGASGVSSIAFGLQQRITTIETLNMSNNEISAKGCQEISELIHKSLTLTKLDISFNEIGERGAELLAETLKWNKTLTYLDISSNRIVDQGGKAIATMLTHNKTLQHLNVRDNAMKDVAGLAFASHIRNNDTLLSINVDMNDFNFQNFSTIMDRLKENKKKFKRELISRHKKSIEVLKVEAEKLEDLKGELADKTQQRILAEETAHGTIAKMEQAEANSLLYAKQLEENIDESRKQIVASTNKSQAVASLTATVKSDKEQRYRNILAKVHKEKDTNRKLQIKLKHLTSLLNEAKMASEREVEDLSARLKIELIDRKQTELDMQTAAQKVKERKESESPIQTIRLGTPPTKDGKKGAKSTHKPWTLTSPVT